jgi:hypothetical protein
MDADDCQRRAVPARDTATARRGTSVLDKEVTMDHRAARPPLEIIDAELHGAPGIALRGQIDVAAVPTLEPALDAAISDTTGSFILDLCELDLLDSSGLGVILRARACSLARTERSRSSARPVPSVTCSRWSASRTCCFFTTHARKLPRRSCRPTDSPVGRWVKTIRTLHEAGSSLMTSTC